MPREILVDWTTHAGSMNRSVTFWDISTSVATQRDALQDFLIGVKGVLDSNITWTIETSGRELNDGSGMLNGSWNDSTLQTGVGAVSGEAVPDAVQMLVRWKTDVITGGRYLQGRQYIPGVSTDLIVNGNLLSTAVADLGDLAQTLAESGAGLQVWHRPVQGAGGLAADVTSGSFWSELAVLRRRRG